MEKAGIDRCIYVAFLRNNIRDKGIQINTAQSYASHVFSARSMLPFNRTISIRLP